MRWNSEITLLSYEAKQNSEGSWVEGTPIKRRCFCNVRSMGSYTWGDAALAGFRADHQIEIRTSDYQGEQEVIFDEQTLQVIRTQSKGEFTVLTVGKRLNNE